MRGAATVLGAGLLAAAVGWAALTVQWDDPSMRTIPPRARVTPSGRYGSWVHLRAGWDAGGAAYLTIVAGGRPHAAPNCQTGVCPTSPYAERVEVRTGDTVVFTVQQVDRHGRAACWILSPKERWDMAPRGARNDNGGKGDGRVECRRVVDW